MNEQQNKKQPPHILSFPQLLANEQILWYRDIEVGLFRKKVIERHIISNKFLRVVNADGSFALDLSQIHRIEIINRESRSSGNFRAFSVGGRGNPRMSCWCCGVCCMCHLLTSTKILVDKWYLRL